MIENMEMNSKKENHARKPTRPSKKYFFAYLLECFDHSYYAGYTTDLKARVLKHNTGQGARYTRSRRPVHLVAAWAYPSKSEALRVESALKKLSHQKKAEIVSLRPSAKELWNELLS